MPIVAIVAPCLSVAHAAQLDGVRLPRTLQMDGKTLRLNGIGLRTYSILGIHIYVAGLYLEHLSGNAEEILHSRQTKLLTIQFERDVSAEEARGAWRTGLNSNCQAPCHLDPTDIAQFLAEIPAVRAGDSYSFFFTGQGVAVVADGKQLGTIDHPQFAEAMLATFLGPVPASTSLKAELLGGHG
jgi:hypothetical protein